MTRIRIDLERLAMIRSRIARPWRRSKVRRMARSAALEMLKMIGVWVPDNTGRCKVRVRGLTVVQPYRIVWPLGLVFFYVSPFCVLGDRVVTGWVAAWPWQITTEALP